MTGQVLHRYFDDEQTVADEVYKHVLPNVSQPYQKVMLCLSALEEIKNSTGHLVTIRVWSTRTPILILLCKRGGFNLAEEMHQKFLASETERDTDMGMTVAIGNLGNMYQTLGDFVK